MASFYDVHMHVMRLEHPSLVQYLAEGGDAGSFVRSGMCNPNFILGGRNLHRDTLRHSLGNLLMCMTGPMERIFELLELDLKGAFTHRSADTPYPALPFFREGKFWMRETSYDRLILCPLLMDFSEDPKELATLYYEAPVEDRIFRYAEETLHAIHSYTHSHPDRPFDMLPFIGITPKVHSLAEIQRLLEYLERGFVGVKVYPPLGFDPWPTEKEARSKVQMIYEYCQWHRIPLITHCDDQGFRLVPYQTAWKWSRPSGWKQVLVHYPELKIDFAHFGHTYAIQNQDIPRMAGEELSSLWSKELIDLMERYPHVYGDLAYSGTSPLFYQKLHKTLSHDASHIRKRILFGSDWSINLMKIESYSAYLEQFSRSPFTNQDIELFGKTNPEQFLFHEKNRTPKDPASHGRFRKTQ